MDKCDVCGKKLTKKYSLQGYTLCSKHMHQLCSHNKFLDTNPRTIQDLNEYHIKDDVTTIDLYDGVTSEKIDECYIDTEDLPKVKYHKWRLSHSHVVTGLPAKKTQRELSWVVMGLDNRKNKNMVIDHINGNPKDNRKTNLRICTQSENILNKKFMPNNTSEYIGVSYRKNRDRYDPEIRFHNIRCHLGYTKTLEEAVYKRMYAEQLLFKEFTNEIEFSKKFNLTKNLSEECKQKLENIVIEKLKVKNLWQ